METKQGRNQYTKEHSSTGGTKLETIEALGFDDPKKTAHRFELLAETSVEFHRCLRYTCRRD
jgi:hypothetical protein